MVGLEFTESIIASEEGYTLVFGTKVTGVFRGQT